MHNSMLFILALALIYAQHAKAQMFTNANVFTIQNDLPGFFTTDSESFQQPTPHGSTPGGGSGYFWTFYVGAVSQISLWWQSGQTTVWGYPYSTMYGESFPLSGIYRSFSSTSWSMVSSPSSDVQSYDVLLKIATWHTAYYGGVVLNVTDTIDAIVEETTILYELILDEDTPEAVSYDASITTSVVATTDSNIFESTDDIAALVVDTFSVPASTITVSYGLATYMDEEESPAFSGSDKYQFQIEITMSTEELAATDYETFEDLATALDNAFTNGVGDFEDPDYETTDFNDIIEAVSYEYTYIELSIDVVEIEARILRSLGEGIYKMLNYKTYFSGIAFAFEDPSVFSVNISPTFHGINQDIPDVYISQSVVFLAEGNYSSSNLGVNSYTIVLTKQPGLDFDDNSLDCENAEVVIKLTSSLNAWGMDTTNDCYDDYESDDESIEKCLQDRYAQVHIEPSLLVGNYGQDYAEEMTEDEAGVYVHFTGKTPLCSNYDGDTDGVHQWNVPQTITLVANDDRIYEPEVNERGQDSIVYARLFTDDTPVVEAADGVDYVRTNAVYYLDAAATNYDLFINDVVVSITDNDPPMVLESWWESHIGGEYITCPGGNCAGIQFFGGDTHTTFIENNLDGSVADGEYLMIALASQPLAEVRVNIADNTDVTQITFDSFQNNWYTFDSQNWDTVQQVLVQGVADVVDEASERNTTITYTVYSEDPVYNEIPVCLEPDYSQIILQDKTAIPDNIPDKCGASVTVVDDDITSLQISDDCENFDDEDISCSNEEGSTNCVYCIKLATAPKEDTYVNVVIHEEFELAALRDEELEVQYQHGEIVSTYGWTQSVTFTDANWDVPATVTLRAYDDPIDEPETVRVIYHTLDGTDAHYSTAAGLDTPDNTVTITDNDESDVLICGMTVDDDRSYGRQDTHAIGEGSVDGILTADNIEADSDGNKPDCVIDSSEAAASQGGYTVVLATSPGTYKYKDMQNGEEGGFSVETEDVYVVVTPESSAQTTFDPPAVSFTADNWNVPQTIMVVPVDDVIYEETIVEYTDHTITQSHMDSDAESTHWQYVTNYATSERGGMDIFNHVIATNHTDDNDATGISLVTETESAYAISVTEGETFTYYTMALTSRPMIQEICSSVADAESDAHDGVQTTYNDLVNQQVEIIVYNDVTPQVEITQERKWQQKESYYFDMDSWDKPQYVYIYAHNDKLEEELTETTLSLEITGQDSFYNNVTTTPIEMYDVTVTVSDNDKLDFECFEDCEEDYVISSLYTSCRQTKLFQYTNEDNKLDVENSEWLIDFNCDSGDMGGLPGFDATYKYSQKKPEWSDELES